MTFMRANAARFLDRGLAVAAVALLPLFAARAAEPRDIRITPSDSEAPPALRFRYVKFDVEAEESRQSGSGGVDARYDRIYFSPGIGVEFDNAIYHPDLFNYSILAEPGWSWQASGPPGGTTHEENLLLNGTFRGTLLQLKPYATTFTASADHDTHQYDFFSSVIEDTRMWGVTSGYREGPVPTTVSFEQSWDDTHGLSYDSSSDQSIFTLHGQNERKNFSITDLSYQFSQYHSVITSSGEGFPTASVYHNLTLNDTEHFNHSTLGSTLLFDSAEDNGSGSDNLNVTASYNIEHAPQLHSFYDYSFTRYANDGGETVQNFARAGLSHQLYESLSSSADLHGATSQNDYFGSTLDSGTVGTSVSVNYTKRLGDWGRLSLGENATLDWTEQQSGGAALLIADESHVLTNLPARLNQPRVLAILSVVDSATHLLLQENVDYTVIKLGEIWEIQGIPARPFYGHTVLVTYTVQPNPSGNYSVFSNQAQIRLDLWHNLLGIYARYSLTDNHASSPDFVLEDVREFQAGADFSHRGLRLAANYVNRDSSLFKYHAYNLTESYSHRIASDSTLGINLGQHWNFYPPINGSTNATRRLTFYDFILRYDWTPVRNVNWSVEGGYERQRGDDLNQDLFVARSYLNWVLGKLDIHFGYEYQNQKFTAQSRERHFVYMRVRRNF
jgi:hypothetical protein